MTPVYDKLAGDPCNAVHYMITLDDVTHLAWDDIEDRVFFYMVFSFTEMKLRSDSLL